MVLDNLGEAARRMGGGIANRNKNSSSMSHVAWFADEENVVGGRQLRD